jgi:hypothetical protein
MTFKVQHITFGDPEVGQRAVEAAEFLRAYDGTFGFLQEMKSIVMSNDTMSVGQIDAVLRCKDRELKWQQEWEAKNLEPGGVDLSVLPTGTHYFAVTNDGGTTSFFRVDHVAEENNSWNGWLFVKHIVGGSMSLDGERVGKQRPKEKYDGKWAHLLERIVEDPKTAMVRFGQEIGRCGVCGKVLTDETSRAFGIGPICREGW